LKIEKLEEKAEQLKQAKESAEKQIRTMSAQLMSSLENYRKGLDEILERNKAEFEESKKKLEERNEQLRKQVCQAGAFSV